MKRWTIWVSNDKIVGAGEERPTRLIACEPIEVAPASEVERLRELAEAGDALFRWLQDQYPAGLVAAPTSIMQRLQRASTALHPDSD